MIRTSFTTRVIEYIRAIPVGSISTYGRIAALAGTPRGARQVARILHSCSQQEDLPWHRVVNREGCISLTPLQGGKEQRQLLEEEGVEFDHRGRIDLHQFLWLP